ncbi:hypothetical protein PT974_12322 [Cladobotryum mycophilum]|uniref:Fucose-specific lectin n=1 Tax=Cladobotryum mycophilum TaxID=491253 RepID=A0ABR0S7M4_9HYPO
MPAFTSEARTANLRDRLAGIGTRATSSKPGESLLTSIALHALVRNRQGKDLTPIESLTMGLFDKIAADDKELDAYAEIISDARKQAKSSKSTSGWLTTSTIALQDDEPYTMEHFQSDFTAVAKEITDRPNSRIVDPANPNTLDADNKIFEDAVEQTGRGTTVFWSDAETSDDPETENKAQSKEAGKDEIYWSLASGADTYDQLTKEQVTDEFGSVEKGTWREFPSKIILFDGMVSSVLSAHIVCWEADHSNSEWYNTLILVSRLISQKSSEMAKITGDERWDELIGQLRGYNMRQEVLMWIQLVSDLIANFMELVRNDDDKVAEHCLAWNLPALNQLYSANENYDEGIDFDGGGGGRHMLYVGRVPGANDADNGQPRFTSSQSQLGSWTNVEKADWKAFNRITMTADASGSLRYVASRPSDDGIILVPSMRGAMSSKPRLGNFTTPTRPAVATTSDGLHIVYRGHDRHIHATHQGAGGQWNYEFLGENIWTRITPGLCAFKDGLFCVYYGEDGDYYWGCAFPPALCSYGDNIYMFYTERSELFVRLSIIPESFFRSSQGGHIGNHDLHSYLSAGGMSATVWNDKIYVANRRVDNTKVDVNLFDTDKKTLEGVTLNEMACGDPQLCVVNQQLRVLYYNRVN